MYKFSNGLVFYTKEDADKAIRAGYKLIERQIDIDEAIDETNQATIKSINKPTKSTKKSTRTIKSGI